MILLTSDGLSSASLLKCVKEQIDTHQYQTATIVVTADKRFKKKSHSAQVLREQLSTFNLDVTLFDFGEDEIRILDESDVIVFDGGNPFYLLLKLKEFKMQNKLLDYQKNNKFIIGVSGGSLVLQKSLALIDEFAGDMNMRHGGDLKGMGLIEVEMLPHRTRYTENFDNFIERYENYKSKHNVETYLVEDGEGILVSDTIEIIKSE